MLSKKTINTVLNNNYNGVKFDYLSSIVLLTNKQKFFTLKKNIQTIMFYELKTYCKKYAENNNFKDKLISNNDFKEWFKMFEIEFNKNKKDK